MSGILTIARRDLTSYFTNLKGPAIVFIFLLLMGVFFSSFVFTFVEMQRQAGPAGGEAPGLDQLFRALFYNVHFIFILLIPAVTMSTFAEERKNQSIRLLQTAPVSPMTIVLGKFVAAVGMLGIVLLASSVYPLYLVLFGNPDPGPIWTSYLGIFLLVASQVAFGLWVSSMTTNQFMAFLFTMAGLFLLLILNWIAPNLGSGGSLESTLKYLASTPHLDSFLKGMLTVSDVAYFVLFTALFLFFTNVSIDSQRWR